MPRTSLDPASTALDDAIMRLLQMKGTSPHADLLKDIIATALGCIDDDTGRGELKIIRTALREMRLAFRLFAPYAHVRKVSIFGSARTAVGAPEYQQAFRLAERMAAIGYMVITGAGGGIMRAANEGAGRDKSFGLLIRLPFEDVNEVLLEDEKLLIYKYFFTRKLTFVKETDGLVLFPGGFGTLDECFEVLTLVQTGKSDLLPIVFLDVPGGDYWRSFARHTEDQLVRRGLISADDPDLYLITEDVDEAIGEIVRFYRNFHSLRYVGEKTVLRHIHPVDDALLDALNHDFGDILRTGRIERSEALPEEVNEPDIATLPRLVLNFNRRSIAGLRRLVNRLNRAVGDSDTRAAAPAEKPGVS